MSREFTIEEAQLVGDVVRFLLENKGTPDSVIIEKFGERALTLTKEWGAAVLDWENNKEARMQKIIDDAIKNQKE